MNNPFNPLKLSGAQEIEKQKRIQAKQEEYKIMLIKWQIENKIIIQPVLQGLIDRLQANLLFVEADEKQIEALKQVLNKQ